MTGDKAVHWRPVRSSKGLADQLVVFGVRSDPEPNDAVRRFHTHRAITYAHARRVEAPDLRVVIQNFVVRPDAWAFNACSASASSLPA